MNSRASTHPLTWHNTWRTEITFQISPQTPLKMINHKKTILTKIKKNRTMKIKKAPRKIERNQTKKLLFRQRNNKNKSSRLRNQPRNDCRRIIYLFHDDYMSYKHCISDVIMLDSIPFKKRILGLFNFAPLTVRLGIIWKIRSVTCTLHHRPVGRWYLLSEKISKVNSV